MTDSQVNSEASRTLDNVRGVRVFGANPTQEQWSSIVAWAEPLINRDWLDGATSRKAANMILSLSMAVLGDAYGELGRPHDAAQAYHRAFLLYDGACCADAYAKLVLKHNLSDHYSSAANALRASTAKWQTRSFRERLRGNLISFKLSPLNYLRHQRDRTLRNRRMKNLERRHLAAVQSRDCDASASHNRLGQV